MTDSRSIAPECTSMRSCRAIVNRRGAVLLAALALPCLAAAQEAEAVAAQIVKSLKPEKGERVLIRCGSNGFAPLVDPLRRALRAAGTVVPDPIRETGPLSGRALASATALVRLAPAGPPADEEEAVAAWLSKGGARRELRYRGCGGSLRPDGLPAGPASDPPCAAAISIGHAALAAAQEKAMRLLRLTTVRINTPQGTDVMFRIGQRTFYAQDGDASAARARRARGVADRVFELPAGILRVAPVEEGFFGALAVAEVRLGEAVARGVVFELDNGRVTRVRAKEGLPELQAALKAAGEGAMRFGEFALGFNPALAPVAGDGTIPHDGFGAGVISIGFGNNEDLGGDVREPYRRRFLLPDATMHVDFRYLVRGGKLVLEDTPTPPPAKR